MLELKVVKVDDEGVFEVVSVAAFVEVDVDAVVFVDVAVVDRFCFGDWARFSPFRDSKFFKIPFTGGGSLTENDLKRKKCLLRLSQRVELKVLFCN